MPNDDFILNWRNQLMPDAKGANEKIAELFDAQLEEGLSIDGTVEVLVGAGCPLDVVRRIANARKDSLQTEAHMSEPEQSPEPPRSYGDVGHRIEAMIRSLDADDAVNLLAGRSSKAPALMRLTNNERSKFRSALAHAAKTENPQILNEIHTWIAPYVETAIIDTEILASEMSENKRTAIYQGKGKTSSFIVEDGDGKEFTVDAAALTCTCPRYVFGSFAHTGLICEHIAVVLEVLQD